MKRTRYKKFQQLAWKKKKKKKSKYIFWIYLLVLWSSFLQWVHTLTFKTSLDWSFFFLCCQFQSLSITFFFYSLVIASQRPHVVYYMHSGICLSLSHITLEDIFPQCISVFCSSLSVLPFVFLILLQSKVIALES